MSDPTEDAWTIKRLLEWTTNYFQTDLAESPRLEAEILLAEALNCPRIMLYTRFDDVPDSNDVAQFREWVKRRHAGEPVAYIVGHREFYSLKFMVNKHVLIPRPETEHLVVAALEAAREWGETPVRVMDMGTGSGCIAVTLAKHLENALIAATDLSSEALAVAKTNATTHQVQDRIRFFEGDLFAALPQGSKPVHLIVSNPPYVGTDEKGTVEESVRRFEPDMALYSGPQGLDVITRLVEESVEQLLPNGVLIFEASPLNMEACQKIVTDTVGLNLVKVVNDLAGFPRILIARKTTPADA